MEDQFQTRPDICRYMTHLLPSGIKHVLEPTPPFSPMKEGYEILNVCMEMSNTIIALMPWLTIINSERRTKKILDFGLHSVTHLPRTAFPGSRVQTCILDMQRGVSGDTKLLFYK